MNFVPIVKIELTQGQAVMLVEMLQRQQETSNATMIFSTPGTPLHESEKLKLLEFHRLEQTIQKAMQR